MMTWVVYWHWFALALVLIIAETLGAAGFLLVIGFAAIATGALTWCCQLSWEWQLVIFSISSIAFAFIWWQFLKSRPSQNDILINKPLEAMIGRTALLVMPIENGRGKIRINDAYWFVTGPDLPIDTKVRIVAVVEETLLVVEPVVD